MSGLEKPGRGAYTIEGMMDGRESKTNKWKFIMGNFNRKKMDNVFDAYKLHNNKLHNNS